MPWQMSMIISWSFPILRFIAHASAMVENHHKSLLMSLSKKCTKRCQITWWILYTMASATNNDQQDGIFLPKGAAYLLGPQTYAQVLQENKFFLISVATIPVNVEYNVWFAVINLDQTSNTELISLHDHLLWKPWFLRIKSVAKNKCLIITMQPNLLEGHAWNDVNLEMMIRKSISLGIDLPSSLLPHHLDKPVYLATSHTYANILKKQSSLALTPTTPATANNQPPCKRQAMMLDYD